MKDFRNYFKVQSKKKSHQYSYPCLSVRKKPLCPSWLLCKWHTCGRIFARQSCLWMMAHVTYGSIKREGSLRCKVAWGRQCNGDSTPNTIPCRSHKRDKVLPTSCHGCPALLCLPKQTRPSGYWGVQLPSGALGGSRNAGPSFLGRWAIRKPSKKYWGFHLFQSRFVTHQEI